MTSFGSSGLVDEAVKRLGTTYDDMGRVETLTSFADTAGTMAVNQVKYAYNGWGLLAREYQEHDGPVDGNTPFVQYFYETGAVGVSPVPAKYVRLGQLVYPNGREVNYDYGTTGAIDDIMSRLSAIEDDDGSTVLASYKYLGAGRIVTEDYEDVPVKLDYNADDNLGGFDRFGRVVDQLWTDYGANPAVAIDRYTYTYDRAGNRTAKTNELNHDLDETYGYDPLDRLEWWNLDGVRQKTWSLDGLGNNLAAGTYNPANEATPMVGSSGYDAAGNMTTLQSGDTATYDAWNRLVEVNIDAEHDQWYEYDAAGRRIATTTRDYDMYSEGDDYHVGQQVVETIAPAEGSYQFVWSPRYIDGPILRDTLDGGVVETAERVYYLADANFNVTGLVKYDSGADEWQVAERYTYTPYGDVTYRDGDWYAESYSANANTTLYTGRTLDTATGLYYYRARYYDAGLERFVTRDPIGYQGSRWNLYEYVGGNPLLLTDSHGLAPDFNICPPPGCSSWGSPWAGGSGNAPTPATFDGTHGPVNFAPSVGVSSPCPNIAAAMQIANSTITSGKCKDWFDGRLTKCPKLAPPNDYDLKIVPFIIWPPGASSNTIPLLGNNIYFSEGWCNEPVGVLALILIHEMAHHYCPPYGPAGDECAEGADDACRNEGLNAAAAAGYPGYSGPIGPAPPSPPYPGPWPGPGPRPPLWPLPR